MSNPTIKRGHESTRLPYRYPGTKPFIKSQANVFFGRKNDVNKLYSLLFEKKIVVLYSESGLGKSSLINAGLIPKFEEDCTNGDEFALIKIRFGNYDPHLLPSPGQPENQLLAILLFELEKNASSLNLDVPYIRPSPDIALWYCIKRFERNGRRILLIFDQAEEIFSFPPEMIKDFRYQLLTIINSEIPTACDREISELLVNQSGSPISGSGDEINTLNENIKFIYKDINARLLFVIRSDNFGLMKSFEDCFPNILKDTFQLLALGKDGAREAIIKPAAADGLYLTPAFHFDEGAVDKFLDSIQEADNLFDPFSIQLNCRYIERIVAGRGKVFIKASNIPDNAVAVNDFLESAWSVLPDHVKANLPSFKKIISERLIDLEHKKRIYANDGLWLDRESKAILIDEGLIKEENRGGINYIELSHDRLVSPLLNDYLRIKEMEQKEIIKRQNKQITKERLYAQKAEKAEAKAKQQEEKAKDAAAKAKEAAKQAKIAEKQARESEKQAKASAMEAARASRIAKRRFWLSVSSLVVACMAIVVLLFMSKNLNEQKDKYKQVLGRIIVNNAGKAYAESNTALAFNLAAYADSLLERKGELRDSILKDWDLHEYAGDEIQISRNELAIACHYRNNTLQIFNFTDSIRRNNSFIFIEKVNYFKLSDDGKSIAIVDTSEKRIKLYNLVYKKGSIDTSLIFNKQTSTSNIRENLMMAGKTSIALGSLDTLLLLQPFGETRIPLKARVPFFAGAETNDNIFLQVFKDILKINLQTGEWKYLNNQQLVASRSTKKYEFVYDGSRKELFRIQDAGSGNIIDLDFSNIKFPISAVSETESYFIVSGTNQNMLIPKKTRPLSPTNILQNGIYILYSEKQPMFIANDSLIVFSNDNKAISSKVSLLDSLQKAKVGDFDFTGQKVGKFYLSADGTTIYASSGFARDGMVTITLSPGNAPKSVSSYPAVPFYNSILRKFDLAVYAGYFDCIRAPKKDFTYWRNYYEPISEHDKKAYNIEQ